VKLRYTAPNVGDALLIARRMRPQDIAELRAGFGRGPLEAIAHALEHATFARMVHYGFEPFGLYGTSPLSVLGGLAQVFIFVTDAVDRYPYAFARASKLAARELQGQHRMLMNFVDAKDERVLRWLRWLGARLLPPVERGGRLFHQFILDGDSDVRRSHGH
jgi:hypothetical protein